MMTPSSENRLWISTLTFKKAWNALLVLTSYQWSKMSKRPVQWGLPMSISVEPTTACNLGCPECPSGLKQFTRPTGNLQMTMFEKILEESYSKLMYMLFYFQGEPYIHPQFLDLVQRAVQKGVYTATSTNAHFLDDKNAKRTVESGLHRLIISIDGTTQDVYEQYRIHGDLEKVIEGTKNIVKWKKELNSQTPHVIFQFLVVRPNEHQLADVQELATALGVDEVRYKTAQINDYSNGSPLIPTLDQYSRYIQKKDGSWALKNKLMNRCWRMWHSCVITWDGRMVPCCFDKDASHQVGNLRTQNLKEAWFSESYASFRKSVFISRSEIDICTNCSEGTKVWGETFATDG
jgi:radical SAM protein with 4Fe4S-binding SPASM domain